MKTRGGQYAMIFGLIEELGSPADRLNYHGKVW